MSFCFQRSTLCCSISLCTYELSFCSIEVSSELGRGTEFDVYLKFPKVNGPAEAGRSAAAEPFSLEGRTILLCEDNEMNREIATAILEKNGMTVIPAVNGKEGAAQFECSEAGGISAVLMDIRMPVMDGYEAARAIRASGRPDADVPIIALSADVYTEDIKKARECGMTAHLSKPLDPELLLKTLREHIKAGKTE